MMTIELYAAFIAACAILSVTPGPNMSLFIANGAAHGSQAALATVAGTALGNSVLAGVTAAGMAAAAVIFASWFDLIRWAGALYLIWLGLGRLRLYFAGAAASPAIPPARSRWFLQGLAVSLSNPKVLLFLGAFFPQFVVYGAAQSPGAQLALLAVTFVAVTTIIDAGLAMAAGAARGWFTPERRRAADGITGALLVLSGVWLAAQRRPV